MIPTDAPANAITLSTAELDVCWDLERLDAERWPVELERASPGGTRVERAMIVGRLTDQLRTRKLITGDGLDIRLAGALHVMARPQRTVDAWVFDPELVLRAVGAVVGEHAVVARQVGEQVSLWWTDAAHLVHHMLAITGNLPAGPGESISVLTEAFTAAAASSDGDPQAFAEELIAHGVRSRDAGLMAQMCAGSGARGQLGCSVGGDGELRRIGHLAYHDTPRGRYCQTQQTNQGGIRWTTISPADNQRLATNLSELLSSEANP